MTEKSLRNVYLVVGPVLFFLCCNCLPEVIFDTYESRAAIGVVAWMAFWWITAPIDYAVTAFLPIIVNALVKITDMGNVISNYASETVILLLAASILAISWEKTGLDHRVALGILKSLGNNYRKQIIFWFLLSVILSAILPNAIVCATITPIAISMLKYIGENDIAESKIGSKILLTIVYAVGVGGLVSPLGGAMNLITVNYIEQLTGKEYMYISWVIRFLPLSITLIICNILFLIRDANRQQKLVEIEDIWEKTPVFSNMSKEEKISFVLFLIATVLAFTRQFYQSYLPGLKPAYSFLICAVLSFVFTGGKDKGMTWKSVQKDIVWDMMLIFAGGMALGTLVNESGAANAIGESVSKMGLTGGFWTIAIIILVTILMSDVTSNTATAAIAMPMVISIIQGIGLNALPYIYITSIGVNLSFMLPTSIRAIPVGYGLPPRYMLKEGWKLTLIVWALMTIVSYILLKYWPMFSGV